MRARGDQGGSRLATGPCILLDVRMRIVLTGAVLSGLSLLAGCWQQNASSSGSSGSAGGGATGGSAVGGGSGVAAPECGPLRLPRADPLPPGVPDASTPDAALRDAGTDAAVDAAVPPRAQDASIPNVSSDAAVPFCADDGGAGMPIYGVPCDPDHCPFTTFLDCMASCNTCSDGVARWVTACGLLPES